MDQIRIRLDTRSVIGKKVKRLRRQGCVPVHVYGWGGEPSFHQVGAQELGRVLPRVGTNVPLTVEVEDGEAVCFVREVQRHPVSEEVLHVDFLRVDVSKTIQSEVPVVLDGAAPAAVDMGGTVMQPLQSVLVESLPMDVPGSFVIDVSGLDDFEKAVYVRDVKVGSGVTLLTSPDELLARVSAPRIEADAEAVDEEAEEAEPVDEEAEV